LGAKIEKKSPHPPVSAIFSVPLSFCRPSRRPTSLPASLQVASPTTSRPPGTTVGPSLSLSLLQTFFFFFLLCHPPPAPLLQPPAIRRPSRLDYRRAK